MSTKYNIHPDFARFPVFTFKFSPLIVGLMNLLIKVTRWLGKRSFTLNTQEHTLVSADGSPFKVIVMTPHDLPKSAPVLLYYHGGGFALTYASNHLQNCERYANDARCIVVFVDYRLAPKHPFPCAFDDSYAALEWVVKESDKLGIDPSRIAVGGDSAGGALAAGVAQKARDEQLVTLCGQLLIYPVLDNSCCTPSATDFVDVPLWNAISNRRMWEMYLSQYSHQETPLYAAPGHGQLRDLPLSYVETAEFDPLRDEGLNYIAALQAENTEVVTNETRQTVHGYDGNAKSSIAKQSMLERVEFLQQAFAPVAD
ncbi:Carboxylesterase NlhH [Halioglobus japonicus]|nr:Carboxylesterase NlhH [Halioglobus japonicus]